LVEEQEQLQLAQGCS
jgi:hypothetical protein